VRLKAILFFGLVGLLASITFLGARAEPRLGSADDASTVNPIMMKDNAFEPTDITINVGDQVKWTNVGNNTHTATSDDIKTGEPKETFNTGRVKKVQSASLNFNKAGQFKYHCEFHDGMTGTITVKVP
jgi:plastocyanin